MKATNSLGFALSSNATLTVRSDTNPPVIVRAIGSAGFTNVTVVFDDLVDPTGAADPFNYAISGLTVIAATLNSDGKSVTLLTDMQAENTLYTVTVTGLRDLAFASSRACCCPVRC